MNRVELERIMQAAGENSVGVVYDRMVSLSDLRVILEREVAEK